MPMSQPVAFQSDDLQTHVLSVFIEKMNQAQNKMREAEAENGNKEIASKRKSAVLLAIDAFRSYVNQFLAKQTILSLLEKFSLSFIAENIFLLKNEMGLSNYQKIFGEAAVNIEISLKQRIFLLEDYQRCVLLKKKLRNRIIKLQKNPDKYYFNWTALHLYREKLNKFQKSVEQYLTQPFVQEKLELTLRQFYAALSRELPATFQRNRFDEALKPVVFQQENVKDIYAIERILEYLDLAISIDLNHENGSELGVSVIERTLQVVGEYLKSTQDSPHISSELETIIQSLGVPAERIKKFRDGLSHSGLILFYIRDKIGKKDLFISLQKDFKRIKTLFLKILYRKDLKQIKALIAEIEFYSSEVSVVENFQAILTDQMAIAELESLDEIHTRLSAIAAKLSESTDKPFVSKLEQVNAILLSIGIRNVRKEILSKEALGFDDKNFLHNEKKFEEKIELEGIKLINFLKENRVIPSKSSITPISTVEGLLNLPSLKSITHLKSTKEYEFLYTLFIKQVFHDSAYWSLYKAVKEKLDGNEVLLEMEVDNKLPQYAPEFQRPELKARLDDFKGRLKLIHTLRKERASFLNYLHTLTVPTEDERNFDRWLETWQLSERNQKLLIRLSHLFLHSIYAHNAFNDYFDGFITQAKEDVLKISDEYQTVFYRIEAKKKCHQIKLELLAFYEGEYFIPTQREYDQRVAFLKQNNALIKKDLRLFNTGFNAVMNQEEKQLKTLIEKVKAMPDSYQTLIKVLKEKERAVDIRDAFVRFVTRLDLNEPLTESLTTFSTRYVITCFEELFFNKIATLKRINDNFASPDQKLMIANEMLLLDISNIYKNLASLYKGLPDLAAKRFDPQVSLLVEISTPKGFKLRNYLAHGDALLDALQPDLILHLMRNIPRLIADAQMLQQKDDIQNPSSEESELPTILSNKPLPAQENVLEIVKNNVNAELREAIAQADMNKINVCFESGFVDIKAEDEQGWNLGFFAVEAESLEVLKLLKDKNVKFDAYDHSFSLSMHYLVLQGKHSDRVSLLLNTLLENNPGLAFKGNKRGFKLLHFAAMRGFNTVVMELLTRGLAIKESADGGWTALSFAIVFKQTELVKQFVNYLKERDQFNAVEDLGFQGEGITGLNLAISSKNREMIKFLLENGVPIDQTNQYGIAFSPLHHAVMDNSLNLVELLCNEGADINVKSGGKEKIVPLHLAAAVGYSDIMDFLLKQKEINVNAQSAQGREALHFASYHNQIEIVEKLLVFSQDNKKVDIDFSDNEGNTALHLAAVAGHSRIVQLLMNHHANVLAKLGKGTFALQLAVASYPGLAQCIEDEVEIFAEVGRGFTPLHLAALAGHVEVVRVLIDNGVPASIKSARGLTPLHLAALGGNVEVVGLLIEKNKALVSDRVDNDFISSIVADLINAHDPEWGQRIKNNLHNLPYEGFTALHLAVMAGHLGVVQQLIKNNAHVSAKGEMGLSALHLAILTEHSEIAEFLIENKADVVAKAGNRRMPYRLTSLHLAALMGDTATIGLLINQQLEINVLVNITPDLLFVLSQFIRTDRYKLDFIENKMAHFDKWTALQFAAALGHIDAVTLLIEKGADVFTHDDDFILYAAILSDNSEIINSILIKIREKFTRSYREKISLTHEEEGDTPLMWAVHLKSLQAIEILLEENVDLDQKNSQGKTALDIALDESYAQLIEDEKDLQGQKRLIQRQQKIVELIYTKTYQSDSTLETIDFQQLWKDFSVIINQQFVNALDSLPAKELQNLKNFLLDKEGLASTWPILKDQVKTQIIQNYPLLQPQACERLMKAYQWVLLMPESLEKLYGITTIRTLERLVEQVSVSSSVKDGCLAIDIRNRKTRHIRQNCWDAIEEETYNPFIEFNDETIHVITLLVAATQASEQQAKIIQTFINSHQIKTEERSHQSQAERERLRVLKRTLRPVFETAEHALQKVSDLYEAALIKISNQQGKSIYLSIHTETVADEPRLFIYCAKINGYRALQFKSDVTLEDVLTGYANLLFPEKAAHSLNYQYYKIAPGHLRFLTTLVDKLVSLDFRPDVVILADHDQRIEALTVTQFRELFLVNGKVPEIAQCHAEIFMDPDYKITFRVEKIVPCLWTMTSEQQSALARLINRYAIEAESAIDNDALPFQRSLYQFNLALMKQLKMAVRLNKPISQDTLMRLAKNYLQSELLAEEFAQEDVTQIIHTVMDFHENLNQGMKRTSAALLRPTIFLVPPLIQAMNGDTDGLKNMLLMIGSDITIDQVYQTIIRHPKFIARFPKSANFLAKSGRYVASPVGKILLLQSFVELIQQRQDSLPGSPEYQLANDLLIDNSVFLASMLAEMLGLELGPLGIIIDLGVTIDQFLAMARYYRQSLPFRVSVWESIRLTLGFDKVWLDEMLMESSLSDIYLQRTIQLTQIMNKNFSSVLIRAPQLLEEPIQITFDDFPKELQGEIIKDHYKKIDSVWYRYTPPGLPVNNLLLSAVIQRPVLSPPKFEKKQYRVEAYRSLEVFLERVNATIYQEKTVFTRTHGHGNWTIAASNTVTLPEEGELMLGSPIEIKGDIAALMVHKLVESHATNLLIHFNPSFGNLLIHGGGFLSGHSLTILIEKIMQDFLRGPYDVRQTSLVLDSLKPFIDKITYVMSDNHHHPSEIQDLDNLDVDLIVLPTKGTRQVGESGAAFYRVIFSTIKGGIVCLDGSHGSLCFIGLNRKNKVMIQFSEDYILSGNVSLQTALMQFIRVRGDQHNPPNFLLNPIQGFDIALLEGKTSYYLNKTRQLECTVAPSASGPEIFKLPHEESFNVRSVQPFNNFSLQQDGSNTHLSTELFTINKNDFDAVLNIHGFYLFKNRQNIQAVMTIKQGKWNLNLINVFHLKHFLLDRDFWDTIKGKKFDTITLHSAKRDSIAMISFRENEPRLVYKGIRYRFDDEQGLVAVQGRSHAKNPLQESFAHALSNVIDVRGNQSLPLYLSETSVKIADRVLIKLTSSTKLLTQQGIIPLGLLAFSSDNVFHRSRREIADMGSPTWRKQLNHKRLRTSQFFTPYQTSFNPLLPQHSAQQGLPFSGEPVAKGISHVNWQQFNGNSSLQVRK